MNAPTRAAIEPFFADLPGRGRRLCIHSTPVGPVRGAVLHVHAFAEELNKTRRMSALAARALAAAGFAVLQVDLLGCGDSDAGFEEATWDDWLRDLAWAAHWLQERHDAPLTLWGVRAGALLAAEAAKSLPGAYDLLLWCPITQGKAVVQQLLRLEAASHWKSGGEQAAIARLKSQLANGQSIEVAGYEIGAGLVHSLEAASFMPPAQASTALCRRMTWLEVSGSDAEADLSANARGQIDRWRAAGTRAHARSVAGPAFWQTVEDTEALALVHATVALMLEPDKAGESAARLAPHAEPAS